MSKTFLLIFFVSPVFGCLPGLGGAGGGAGVACCSPPAGVAAPLAPPPPPPPSYPTAPIYGGNPFAQQQVFGGQYAAEPVRTGFAGAGGNVQPLPLYGQPVGGYQTINSQQVLTTAQQVQPAAVAAVLEQKLVQPSEISANQIETSLQQGYGDDVISSAAAPSETESHVALETTGSATGSAGSYGSTETTVITETVGASGSAEAGESVGSTGSATSYSATGSDGSASGSAGTATSHSTTGSAGTAVGSSSGSSGSATSYTATVSATGSATSFTAPASVGSSGSATSYSATGSAGSATSYSAPSPVGSSGSATGISGSATSYSAPASVGASGSATSYSAPASVGSSGSATSYSAPASVGSSGSATSYSAPASVGSSGSATSYSAPESVGSSASATSYSAPSSTGSATSYSATGSASGSSGSAGPYYTTGSAVHQTAPEDRIEEVSDAGSDYDQQPAPSSDEHAAVSELLATLDQPTHVATHSSLGNLDFGAITVAPASTGSDYDAETTQSVPLNEDRKDVPSVSSVPIAPQPLEVVPEETAPIIAQSTIAPIVPAYLQPIAPAVRVEDSHQYVTSPAVEEDQDQEIIVPQPATIQTIQVQEETTIAPTTIEYDDVTETTSTPQPQAPQEIIEYKLAKTHAAGIQESEKPIDLPVENPYGRRVWIF